MRTFGSLFAGIGGFDLALERAGMACRWQVEIDRDCQRVLATHWPEVPRFDDVKECDVKTGDWYRKLSPSQADSAVAMYEDGLSIAPIAEYFGVSRQGMWDLLRRRTTMRSQKRVGEDNHFSRGGARCEDKAQNVTEYAIRKGVIVRPSICDLCKTAGTQFKNGRASIQAHHCDYNKPLDVMWLCQQCHHEWHKSNRAIALEGGDVKGSLLPVDVICAGFP